MNNRGMTLIETIVTLALTSLLCTLILQVYFSFQTQYNSIIEQNEARENLALGMEQLKQDILNSSGVIECTPGQLQLKGGIYYQLKTDPQMGQHMYSRLTGKVLYRQLAGQTNQPVANFIHTMQLQYLDGEGKATEQSDDVAAVDICLQSRVGSHLLSWQELIYFGAGGSIYG